MPSYTNNTCTTHDLLNLSFCDGINAPAADSDSLWNLILQNLTITEIVKLGLIMIVSYKITTFLFDRFVLPLIIKYIIRRRIAQHEAVRERWIQEVLLLFLEQRPAEQIDRFLEMFSRSEAMPRGLRFVYWLREIPRIFGTPDIIPPRCRNRGF